MWYTDKASIFEGRRKKRMIPVKGGGKSRHVWRTATKNDEEIKRERKRDLNDLKAKLASFKKCSQTGEVEWEREVDREN